MQHVLYVTMATRLGVEDDCLVVTMPDSEDVSIHSSDVAAVVVETVNCHITIPAMLLCTRQGIPVIICNEKYQPELYCLNYHRHSELLNCLTQQLAWQEDQKKKAWLTIVHTKLEHQARVLTYYKKDEQAVRAISEYQRTLGQQDITPDAINAAESISARMYFSALFGAQFKRFAPDAVNHALNYGYALMRSQIMTALTVKGLHPALGLWHHSVRNRFNLADDLLEVLRPLVDWKVYSLGALHSFEKTHRTELLTLIHSSIAWGGALYSVRQGVVLFIDDLVRFMQGQTSSMDTPQLNIEALMS